MKKLLYILSSLGLTATAAATVVSCTVPQIKEDYDLKVGLGIDRSKALDDSNLVNDLGITNFYTIGDSLSDSGGIETIGSLGLNEIFQLVRPLLDKIPDLIIMLEGLVDGIIDGMEQIPDQLKPIAKKLAHLVIKIKKEKVENVKLNIQMTDADGVEVAGYSHGFTNQKPAAVVVAEKLGFVDPSAEVTKASNGKEFKAGVSTNVVGLDLESEQYGSSKDKYNGNNYAIGGATSSTVDNFTGILLNSVQINDQAMALVKQHQTKSTDLVFMEIGGNDLFSLIDIFHNRNKTSNWEQQIETKLDEAIGNIKAALLTLLNNDVKKIIVANAPDVSLLPLYNNPSLFEEDNPDKEENLAVKEFAHYITGKFNKKFFDQFDKINKKYGNTMMSYDLVKKMDDMLKEFTKDNPKKIADKPSVDLFAAFPDPKITDKTLEITMTHKIKDGLTVADLDNYFFWDSIHPGSWAHTSVANDLFDNYILKMFPKQQQ
ncbi:lipolytic enzyme, GDSL family [Williamsoniiplasma somnilux]|uniref:Lipolytic enzyme, GDSL family n=1 Tax=Williamsoniiplasma somnilux TaxID=215578 RepID=A0A2K8NXN0_9MOLU|nr:SGNH/GDSL hydrolase family protein [Williamsoniiplasma somnilux]ATZ18592.1 lipolytic enzyme, GDSL family [Williamsoniiplasma somnilux]